MPVRHVMDSADNHAGTVTNSITCDTAQFLMSFMNLDRYHSGMVVFNDRDLVTTARWYH